MGDTVSDLHIRRMMVSFGAAPHKDIKNELWHHNEPKLAGDNNGSVFIMGKYLELDYTKYTRKQINEFCQEALASFNDPNTNQVYYSAKVDGYWGPKSKSAWREFYNDNPAAFIRTKGLGEKARLLVGMPPGPHGFRVLKTYTARFKIIEDTVVL